MAKSSISAKQQVSLQLISFITPSEVSGKVASKSVSLFDTGLNGKEVSQFYDSVLSTPSIQIFKNDPLPKNHKKTPLSPRVNLTSASIFRFSQEGNIKQIQLCVRAGHSVDEQDAYGWTPLMCATCEGHSEVVEYLLKQGANPDIKCKRGMTPLDIAIKINNSELIKLLQTGNKLDEMPTCSTVEKVAEEKYCNDCKVYYKIPTITHERSIAHLFNTKKTKLSTYYHIPENNKGFQIMLKKGWDKNKGLGPNAEGRKFPIKTVLKKDRACIGKYKEVAKVTHFSANDNAAVKRTKPIKLKSVREKTLKKWQRKKLDEITRRKEINFRRQFNSDF